MFDILAISRTFFGRGLVPQREVNSLFDLVSNLGWTCYILRDIFKSLTQRLVAKESYIPYVMAECDTQTKSAT